MFTRRMKLKAAEQRYIDLLGEQKKKEIELEQMQLRLDNAEKEMQIKIKEKEAEFELREKRQANEHALKLDKLNAEHDIKLKEAISLAKLDAQQQIAQAKVEYENKMLDFKNETLKTVSEKHDAMNKETYDKLKDNLEEIHKKGNASTEFMKDMAIGLMHNRPAADKVGVDVTVGEPLMIEEKTVTRRKPAKKKAKKKSRV